MIEPRPEEFRGGVPIAMYRAVAPTTLKVRKAAEPQHFAAGEVIAAEGYPAAALQPLNHEAVYAKYSGIRKTVRQEGWLPEAVLVAMSLGAPPLSHAEACAFVEAWMRNPQPLRP